MSSLVGPSNGVGKEQRVLGPGEVAFVPMGEVHGTYNSFAEKLIFLAILSPAKAPEPAIVDVSKDEPWRSLRDLKSMMKDRS